MRKQNLLKLFCVLGLATTAYGQNGNVGIGTNTPSASAQLEILSSNKGLLIPRLTQVQRNAIAAPATGLMIYQIDNTQGFYYYNGAAWTSVTSGSGTINVVPKFTTSGTILGNSLIQDNGTNLGINIAPAIQYQLNLYRNQLTANGDGQHALYAFRTRDSQNNGTSYSVAASNSATAGYNFWGDLYTFGVAGYSYNDYTRTGGTLGAQESGTYWGSLGYKNSANATYGAYGTSAYASGGGFMLNNQLTGIGAGFYGGVMGGWVRGEVLGFTAAGEVYASYNLGNEYTSGYQADIVDNGSTRNVAYATTSTKLKIADDGYENLVNGQKMVTFSNEFAALLDATQKPVVTVTAIGSPVALYIKSVSEKGFVVATIDGSLASVEFSWTVSGKRVDASKAALPEILKDQKFNEKIDGAMFNDGNREQNAKYLWWDGSKLRTDAPPVTPRKEIETGN